MQTQTVSRTSSAPRIATDPVIAAVLGKFYRYSAEFSTERPLAYFMDCRANKSRSLDEISTVGLDLELVFLFGNDVRICSPSAPVAARLLRRFALKPTYIRQADITDAEFNLIRETQNENMLVKMASRDGDPVIQLSAGMIIALCTDAGKYALLRVAELSRNSVKIDACHILLRVD